MKDLKLYLIIAFGLLGFYLIAQYNQPKPVNWTPTFAKKDKIPFGTYVIYNRLTDIFPNATIIAQRDAPYNLLTDFETHAGNYILIAQQVKIDGFDFKELKKYMYKGNSVFIAGFSLTNYLTDSLKLNISSERKFNSDAKTPVNFVNKTLNPTKKYLFEKGIGDQYFSSYDTSRTVILGVNDRGHANFIKYNFGRGALYLMASPMFFTNYNMLKPDGAEYAAKALSYLPQKKEIIWDEFSALGYQDEEKSIMRVFLNHDSLKWAYFIALFSLIFFVLYEVKRRQRIIPIIEPLKNTSAEFVKVVGQLYYQRRDNANIAKKKTAYFLEDIRSRYSLKTHLLNEQFAELLAAKSGVKKEFINQLVSQFINIQQSVKISDQKLISLNKSIEQFHHQSK